MLLSLQDSRHQAAVYHRFLPAPFRRCTLGLDSKHLVISPPSTVTRTVERDGNEVAHPAFHRRAARGAALDMPPERIAARCAPHGVRAMWIRAEVPRRAVRATVPHAVLRCARAVVAAADVAGERASKRARVMWFRRRLVGWLENGGLVQNINANLEFMRRLLRGGDL
jgi:hypothetical protein